MSKQKWDGWVGLKQETDVLKDEARRLSDALAEERAKHLEDVKTLTRSKMELSVTAEHLRVQLATLEQAHAPCYVTISELKSECGALREQKQLLTKRGDKAREELTALSAKQITLEGGWMRALRAQGVDAYIHTNKRKSPRNRQGEKERTKKKKKNNPSPMQTHTPTTTHHCTPPPPRKQATCVACARRRPSSRSCSRPRRR